MGSFNLQDWTRIGAMNLLSFVAPVFQPASRADWKVGATMPFMGCLHFFLTRIGTMNIRSEFVLVPRPSSSGSIFWPRDRFEDEDDSTWLKNGS
jgi:hypothetical protein